MSQKRATPVLPASGRETTMRFDSARSACISLTLDPSGGFFIATTVDDAVSEQEAPLPPPSPRLFPAQDRYQEPAARNATATVIPWLCAHDVFEEQVAAAPEAPTASFEDASSSYRDLNGRTNLLAQYLLCKEVEPANLVGISRYYRRSQLNAERFPRSPFGLRETRLYLTGDGALLRDDGAIEILGHSDSPIRSGVRQIGLER